MVTLKCQINHLQDTCFLHWLEELASLTITLQSPAASDPEVGQAWLIHLHFLATRCWWVHIWFSKWSCWGLESGILGWGCKALKSLWLLSPKKHFPVSSLPRSTPFKSSHSVAHFWEGSLSIHRESEWVMWALFLCFFLRHFLGYFCTFSSPNLIVIALSRSSSKC